MNAIHMATFVPGDEADTCLERMFDAVTQDGLVITRMPDGALIVTRWGLVHNGAS